MVFILTFMQGDVPQNYQTTFLAARLHFPAEVSMTDNKNRSGITIESTVANFSFIQFISIGSCADRSGSGARPRVRGVFEQGQNK